MRTKILLVDDNADLLKITQIILKAQGYETFLATSIAEATRKIRIHQPVLILQDVSVCEAEDGRRLCQQLRREAATRGIRLILMSGNEFDEAALRDADDFLQKPFDFNELTEKVAQQIAIAEEQLVMA